MASGPTTHIEHGGSGRKLDQAQDLLDIGRRLLPALLVEQHRGRVLPELVIVMPIGHRFPCYAEPDRHAKLPDVCGLGRCRVCGPGLRLGGQAIRGTWA